MINDNNKMYEMINGVSDIVKAAMLTQGGMGMLVFDPSNKEDCRKLAEIFSKASEMKNSSCTCGNCNCKNENWELSYMDDDEEEEESLFLIEEQDYDFSEKFDDIDDIIDVIESREGDLTELTTEALCEEIGDLDEDDVLHFLGYDITRLK